MLDDDGDGVYSDTDPDGTIVQPWYLDCDGDTVYGLLAPELCLPDGACSGGVDPSTTTTSDPGVYECDDDANVDNALVAISFWAR